MGCVWVCWIFEVFVVILLLVVIDFICRSWRLIEFIGIVECLIVNLFIIYLDKGYWVIICLVILKLFKVVVFSK